MSKKGCKKSAENALCGGFWRFCADFFENMGDCCGFCDGKVVLAVLVFVSGRRLLPFRGSYFHRAMKVTKGASKRKPCAVSPWISPSLRATKFQDKNRPFGRIRLFAVIWSVVVHPAPPYGGYVHR